LKTVAHSTLGGSESIQFENWVDPCWRRMNRLRSDLFLRKQLALTSSDKRNLNAPITPHASLSARYRVLDSCGLLIVLKLETLIRRHRKASGIRVLVSRAGDEKT